MHNRPETPAAADHPLRHLTEDQFMALGGNAVVYVRAISGDKLSRIVGDFEGSDDSEEFQLVVSADGSPLLVADSEDAVAEWLSDKNLGIVAVH